MIKCRANVYAICCCLTEIELAREFQRMRKLIGAAW